MRDVIKDEEKGEPFFADKMSRDKEIDEMHEAMKQKQVMQAYITKIRVPYRFEWEI